MNISPDSLLQATTEEAARQLYTAGLQLTGKPLRRASWLEIAAAVQRKGRIAAVLLARLQAARTREDALRALRIARKGAAGRRQTGSAKGKAGRKAKRSTVEQKAHEQQLHDSSDYYDPWDNWDEWGEWGLLGDDNDFREWQAVRRGELPNTLPYPPVSRLQALALASAWRQQEEPGDWSLRAAVGEETYSRMLALSGAAAAALLPEEEAFFAAHDLHHLLDPAAAGIITDGYGLAGLALLLAHRAQIGVWTVDWFSVAGWFKTVLRQTPGEEEARLVEARLVEAVFYFARHSPATPCRLLLEHFCLRAETHPRWLALLPCFWPRLPELLPALHLGAAPPHWGSGWVGEMQAGVGSLLHLHLLRDNLAGLLDGVLPRMPAAVSAGQATLLAHLLVHGGGSLCGQDYPAFTLTARPAFTIVSAPLAQALGAQIKALWHAYGYLRGNPDEALRNLLQLAAASITDGPDPAAGAAPDWESVMVIVATHARGYATLVEEIYPGGEFRIRRRHVRRLWEKQAAGELDCTPPAGLAELVERFGAGRLIEGLVHALLSLLDERWPAQGGAEVSLKEPFIVALRTLSVLYGNEALAEPIALLPYQAAPEQVRAAADLLLRQSVHAPLELAQALGIGHDQALPLLPGGRLTEWEQRTRRLLREAAGGVLAAGDDQPPRIFECRPLAKAAALARGELGGDCSTRSVPLRATSPHHVYYGIWENGVQQRGYMTVFEAWAEPEEGPRLPVLCLETINAPVAALDAVQQDLLLIFDAIARSRGLSSPVALTTGRGTWNYNNGALLRECRRFRQGEVVALAPADPIIWGQYIRLSRESYYSSFHGGRVDRGIRILAPFDPDQDLVQPENLAEAQRLADLAPAALRVTIEDETGMVGFISAWPAAGPPAG